MPAFPVCSNVEQYNIHPSLDLHGLRSTRIRSYTEFIFNKITNTTELNKISARFGLHGFGLYDFSGKLFAG